MIQVIRERHETPAYVERELRLAGGLNRLGEPNYRAVWGWNRLSLIGGKWEDRDGEGSLIREVVQLREVPKYVPCDRWHIERWTPPEAYGSPAQWYAQMVERSDTGYSVPALGPYPERGEYEHCFTLERPGGGFLQITPSIALYAARVIEASRRNTSSERRTALVDREARKDAEYDAYADDVLSDSPALHGQPFVTVA